MKDNNHKRKILLVVASVAVGCGPRTDDPASSSTSASQFTLAGASPRQPTFAVPVEALGPGFPMAAVGRDFDGDSLLDIAVATNGSPPSIDVYLGRGAGALSSAQSHGTYDRPWWNLAPTLARDADGLAAGDFDGDGRLDLVVVQTLEVTVRRWTS